MAMKNRVLILLLLVTPPSVLNHASASQAAPPMRHFLEQRCFECHDAETKKGELDLTRKSVV